jgi:type IV pilus assembly protein PilP
MLRPAGRVLIVLAAATALGLAGCGKSAPQGPAATGPAKPKPKAQAAEPAPQGQVYAYSPEGKPDPFRPFGVAPTVKKDEAPSDASTLASMELGQFRLVGIADSQRGRLALVQDGAGRGYIIQAGSRIGAGGGLVKEVTLDGVAVEEQVRDYAGRLHTNTIRLKLAAEE